MLNLILFWILSKRLQHIFLYVWYISTQDLWREKTDRLLGSLCFLVVNRSPSFPVNSSSFTWFIHSFYLLELVTFWWSFIKILKTAPKVVILCIILIISLTSFSKCNLLYYICRCFMDSERVILVAGIAAVAAVVGIFILWGPSTGARPKRKGKELTELWKAPAKRGICIGILSAYQRNF